MSKIITNRNKKQIRGILLLIAFLGVGLYGAGWIFNHLHAWVGIAVGVGVLLTFGNFAINFINKNL